MFETKSNLLDFKINFEDVGYAVKTSYLFKGWDDHTYQRFEHFLSELENPNCDNHSILEYYVYLNLFNDSIEGLPGVRWFYPGYELFNKLSYEEVTFLKYRFIDIYQIIRDMGIEHEFTDTEDFSQSRKFKCIYSYVHQIYLNILNPLIVDFDIDSKAAIRILKKLNHYKLEWEILKLISDEMRNISYIITNNSEKWVNGINFDENWVDDLIELLIDKKAMTIREQAAHLYLYIRNLPAESYSYVLKVLDTRLYLNEDLLSILNYWDNQEFLANLLEVEEWCEFRLTQKELKEFYNIAHR